MCLFQGSRKGNVCIEKGARALRAAVPFWKRRCCLTHAAVVCDNPEIQPLLPQFVLGNFAAFLDCDIDALRAACPPNVVLIRQKSAWVNQYMFPDLVAKIAEALEPFQARFQPILPLDAPKVHCSRRVLRACRRLGIWVVLVPALRPWLMQPLAPHGVLAYKRPLRQAYQDALIAKGGDLTMGEFLLCVYSAVRVLFGVDWEAAFQRDGYGARQARLSERVTRELPAVRPQAPSTAPSRDEVALCFPRRMGVPLELLFPPPLHPPLRRAPPVPRATAPRAGDDAVDTHVHGTRSVCAAAREAARVAALPVGRRLPRAPLGATTYGGSSASAGPPSSP